MIIPTCPNICCTGAFVQEGIMGDIMSAEVRQLILTSVKSSVKKTVWEGWRGWSSQKILFKRRWRMLW